MKGPLWIRQIAPLVEVIPGTVSGVPLLKGTRLAAETVLSNYETGSQVGHVSDKFDMPETIRDLLTYAINDRLPTSFQSFARKPQSQPFCRSDDEAEPACGVHLAKRNHYDLLRASM